MRTKKIISVFMALAMVFAMCLGVTSSVSAIEANDLDRIEKVFQMPDEVSTPEVKFNFEFTKVTDDAPEIPGVSVGFTSGQAGDSDNGTKTVIDASDNFLKDVVFTHAGRYEYTLKEVQPVEETVDGTITYSTTVYTVYIYVANDGNGLKVENIVYEDQNGKKPQMATFTNTYAKDTDPDCNALVIEKKVTGTYADLTKKFKFKLTLTHPDIYNDYTVQYVIKNAKDEQIDAGNITYEDAKEFELAHGEKLYVAKLPIGTKHTIIETDANQDDYTLDGIVRTVENGTLDLQNGFLTDAVIVEGVVSHVTFTNKHTDPPTPTGIFVDNLPYIMLMLVAVGGFIAYIAIKRRKMSH